MKNQSQTKIILSLIGMLLFFQNTQAQDSIVKHHNFVISTNIRPKFELRHGYYKPLQTGEKLAAYISQRNRIRLKYAYKDIFSVQLTPQHVFIWGQDGLTQGASTSNSISFFDVWIKFQPKDFIAFQIGRQVISLDDERFFGELDWAQGGRAHDALSVQFKRKKLDLKTYFAFNQNYKELYSNNLGNTSGNLYTSKNATPYKWMQTAWAGVNINQKNKVSFLFTNLGFQDAKTATDTVKNHFSHTLGANYFYKDENWKFNVSAYYQTGKNQMGLKTNAYLLAFLLDRKIGKKWNIGIGTDFVSGNNVGVAPKKYNNAFVPYFGTNHKFYGNMDYFYAGKTHKNTGLADLYAQVGFKPTEKTAINLAFHQFLTPNQIKSSIKNYSCNLGQEIDLKFNYKFLKFANFLGGYSIYVSTPAILYLKDVTKSAPVQHWLWFEIDVNLDIFNYKF